ncbi:MAG: hypothetical protein IMZ62_12800 [Chloroflexi bacterium]|nr:hypothetical protein [Chloroflexota bacterium]MBE3119490.1 hypothetical protein [Candidatus Atribacteria bacterium]
MELTREESDARPAKEGDLRVWWIQNPPSQCLIYPVATVERAIAQLDALTKRDQRHSWVTSNAGGLEVYEDGEWLDWYSEDGEDLDEYAAGDKTEKGE